MTATQIRLQEALGLPRPAYAHLGMVMAPDGTRLGKRAGALGLEALGARQISAEDVLGWLGWSLGCLDQPEACGSRKPHPVFRLGRVPKGRGAGTRGLGLSCKCQSGGTLSVSPVGIREA